MIKFILVPIVIGLSVGLTGCGLTGNAEIKKNLASELYENCVQQLNQAYYNNSQLTINSANLSVYSPNENDAISIGKSIKSNLMSRSQTFEDFQGQLPKNFQIKIAQINLIALNKKGTCDFYYITDHDQNMLNNPKLFRITSGQAKKEINETNQIEPISPIEYLVKSFRSNHGFKISQITYQDQNKNNPIKPNDVQSKIEMVVKSNGLVQFYNLGEPLSLENTQMVAQNAVQDIRNPDYTPQNSIYVVPAMRVSNITRFDISSDSDINERNMEKFNQQRFVDAGTVLPSHIETLNKLKKEFGVGDTSFEPTLQVDTSKFDPNEANSNQ